MLAHGSLPTILELEILRVPGHKPTCWLCVQHTHTHTHTQTASESESERVREKESARERGGGRPTRSGGTQQMSTIT